MSLICISDSKLVLLFCALVPVAFLIQRVFRSRAKVEIHHAQHLGQFQLFQAVSKKTSSDSDSFSFIDLVKRLPAFSESAGFRDTWWLPGGNAQTIYCSVGDFSNVDPIEYERHYLKVVDGGIIAVDITPPLSSHPVQDGENVLLVLHGLTGGSNEAYVRAALTPLIRTSSNGGLGLRAVVMNFRGCNGSPIITPQLYHAGSSDDIRPIVLWICHTFPSCQIFGLGFSLGANILTKYASEEGDDCPLSAIMVLANVWDFVIGSKHIERGTIINRLLYQNVLGGALRTLLEVHQQVFRVHPKSPLPSDVLDDLFSRRSVSLRTHDSIVQTRAYGFRDADDYYHQVSSSRLLHNLKIPCLGINSLDDPIVGQGNLPFTQVQVNPWIVLATTKGGGHMGWFETDDGGVLRRWFTEPVRQFFSALLECDLACRPRAQVISKGDAEFVQDGRPEIGFKELNPQATEIVTAGSGDSKLFTGW